LSTITAEEWPSDGEAYTPENSLSYFMAKFEFLKLEFAFAFASSGAVKKTTPRSITNTIVIISDFHSCTVYFYAKKLKLLAGKFEIKFSNLVKFFNFRFLKIYTIAVK